jgi:hypothetical protein
LHLLRPLPKTRSFTHLARSALKRSG